MKLDVKELIAKLTNTPMVIEQGVSGIWNYRKWDSGMIEAWGIVSDSFAMVTALGSHYYGLKTYNLSALNFTSIGAIEVTGNCAAYYVTTKIETYSTTSLTLTAFSLGSRTDTIKHHISIKGRWK